jgi:hypothetical protein
MLVRVGCGKGKKKKGQAGCTTELISHPRVRGMGRASYSQAEYRQRGNAINPLKHNTQPSLSVGKGGKSFTGAAGQQAAREGRCLAWTGGYAFVGTACMLSSRSGKPPKRAAGARFRSGVAS